MIETITFSELMAKVFPPSIIEALKEKIVCVYDEKEDMCAGEEEE